jgi:hypothetical protein
VWGERGSGGDIDSLLRRCWLPYDIHVAVCRLGQPGGSEHFQFVRHLPHECVFIVVGSDKLSSAEDLQDGMIFAFR